MTNYDFSVSLLSFWLVGLASFVLGWTTAKGLDDDTYRQGYEAGRRDCADDDIYDDMASWGAS